MTTPDDTARGRAPDPGVNGESLPGRPAAAKAPEDTVSGKTSRAGRNLPAAIGVGLVLGLFVILCLFWRRELFIVLATSAVCVGVWELVEALKHVDVRVPLVPTVLGTVAMLVSAFFAGSEALLVSFALTCVLILLWRGSDGARGAAADVTSGFFVAAYPGLIAGFSMLMLAPADGAWRVFTFLAVTVASDIGGYAVGVLFGRHPIAPKISPKKSWEGFAGSVGFCIVVGVACVLVTLHGRWWVGFALGVLVAFAATVGDLIESTIKRDLGIKDMSHILPGHGGILDRLDSLILAAPVTWGVLVALVPVTQ
ncbi:MAG: phosphatidate cytidylyltransferase [Dermatophilaceae bacterium]